jgi:hypothetical protein
VSDDFDPPDDKERAAAARLGRLVDDALAGGAPPALLGVEERELLETATEIHATVHARLPTGRRRALVDAAFAEAETKPAPVTVPRRKRQPAWTLCAIAACAAVMLVLLLRPVAPAPAPTRSDRLVGPIAADRVDDARSRLDVVYADRIAQHRATLLAGRAP